MGEEEAGASTTAGESAPTNAMSPQELYRVARPEGYLPDVAARIPATRKRKLVDTDSGDVTVFPEIKSGSLLGLASDMGNGQEVVLRPGNRALPRSRWVAKNPTGAFTSAAASFRYMPKEYNWFEVLWSVGILYGLFIGVPVGAAFWSLHRIGTIVGWW